MVRFMAYMLVRRKTDYLHLLTFAINKLYFGVFRVIVDWGAFYTKLYTNSYIQLTTWINMVQMKVCVVLVDLSTVPNIS